MELAGLESDTAKRRPARAPERIVRPSAEEADFEDVLPDHIKAAPAPLVDASDDEFMKLIEEDVKAIKKGSADPRQSPSPRAGLPAGPGSRDPGEPPPISP